MRQTWLQYLIKKDMGLLRGLTEIKVRFHWRFWAPIDCVGGKLYFGRYVEHSTDWQEREGRKVL